MTHFTTKNEVLTALGGQPALRQRFGISRAVSSIWTRGSAPLPKWVYPQMADELAKLGHSADRAIWFGPREPK
jgi:hypothetical protein